LPDRGRPALVARPWYGWVVVGAAFLCLTLSAGFGFYSLSTYARYLVEYRGLSLAVTSIGSTVFMLASGAGGILVARLIERRDVRLTLCAGTVVCVATLPLLGLSRAAWQLWVVYAVYGLGSAGISVIPASTLVMRWFGSAPGRPMAIGTTGLSVGGALAAPLVATWVARAGLLPATIGMAVILAAVIVPLSVLAVRSPTDPRADARWSAEAAESGGDATVGIVAERARQGTVPVHAQTLAFTTICVAFGLLMLSQVASVTHMLTLAAERHIPGAPVALSVLAGTSVAGRLLGIPVLPRIGLRNFCIGNAALQAVAMVALAFAHGQAGLLASAALLGATVGNTVVLLPLSLLDSFGLADYPRRYAQANLFTSFGVALGPLLLGLMHGAVGSYQLPVIILGMGSGLASVLLATIRREKSPRRHA